MKALESLLGRNCKPSMRKYVQYEFKPDRFEGRLLVRLAPCLKYKLSNGFIFFVFHTNSAWWIADSSSS